MAGGAMGAAVCAAGLFMAGGAASAAMCAAGLFMAGDTALLGTEGRGKSGARAPDFTAFGFEVGSLTSHGGTGARFGGGGSGDLPFFLLLLLFLPSALPVPSRLSAKGSARTRVTDRVLEAAGEVGASLPPDPTSDAEAGTVKLLSCTIVEPRKNMQTHLKQLYDRRHSIAASIQVHSTCTNTRRGNAHARNVIQH